MSPFLIIICIAAYFGLLLLISWLTSKQAGNDAYFTGNHMSPWIAVAFGMLGDSLSGVTFISVPGAVYYGQFYYLQLVLGYLAGYFAVSRILLPVYYKMKLISVYSYLGFRLGTVSQKTGALIFIVSRVGGAAGRLYLAASVIQLFVFDDLKIPFAFSVFIILMLMLLYTYRGGIKTLVWTDTLKSGFLLAGVILSIYFIAKNSRLTFSGIAGVVSESPYSGVFSWDILPKSNFFKMFLGGFFMTITMTGLDQNMMQKNLSCRSLKDARKNMESFSFVMFIVNVCFLSLGALLYYYVQKMNITLPVNAETGKVVTDKLFPTLALKHLGLGAGIVFIIGLTAATFSSADSVLTTLTTSFYIDFLNADKKVKDELKQVRLRKIIHFSFAIILLLIILLFKALNNAAVIDSILTLATYTYGPLLGLFSFGILTSKKSRENLIPLICLISPFICFVLDSNSENWFWGYDFGYELLALNGALTFFLLYFTAPSGNFEKEIISQPMQNG